MVDDRSKAALLLESAETKLIKTCNKIAVKKGRKQVPEGYDKNISTLYIPDKKRPHTKIGKYPVIKLITGKKVFYHFISLIKGRFDQLVSQ